MHYPFRAASYQTTVFALFQLTLLDKVVDGSDVTSVPHLYLHTPYTLLSLLVAPIVGHPGSHTMAISRPLAPTGERSTM